MPRRTADGSRLGRVLGGALVALLPVFFVDGFHDPFTASKLIPLLVLGVPAALLLSPRTDGHDALDRWRRAAMVLAPTWILAAWVQGPADRYPLLLIATGWIFMTIGAAFGTTTDRRARLVTLVAASAVPVLLVGVLRRYADLLTFIPDRPDVAMAATIGNSNELAEYAAPVAVLALLLPATSRKWGWALVAAAAALVALSESRGGMLALGAGVIVAALTFVRRPGAPRQTGRIALAAVGVGVIALLAMAPDRVASVFDRDHPTNVVRRGLWEATVDLWLDQPVLGCGAGRYEAALPPFRDVAEWKLSGLGSVAESPHNEILWLLATGGILGVATLLDGASLVFRWWRDAAGGARDRPDEGGADLTMIAVSLGSLAAFAVTALVRSPLHHPTGVMAPALAVGVLAAMAGQDQPDRRPVPPAVWMTWLSLAAALWVGYEGLRADARVYTARRSKVEANEALKARDVRAAVDHFRAMTEALRALEDGPPLTADHAYRAALVGSEVSAIRGNLMGMAPQLERQGLESPERWLPATTTITSLLDSALDRAPHHHLALLERARFHLRAGEIAAAARALDDVGWRDLAWPGRLEMKGQVVLKLGSTPDTFGTWLDAAPAAPTTVKHADAAHAALIVAEASTDAAEGVRQLGIARTEAFRHLGLAPRDQGVMKVLTDIAAKVTPPPDWGNDAVARSRLLFALEAMAQGNDRMTTIHLRIARNKDPHLLDAHFLAARIAAKSNDTEALEHAVKALLDMGLAMDVLVERATADGFGDAVRQR